MTEKTKSNRDLEKKVREAINQLEAKHEKVTNPAVRAITGGSFRDISPLLREIKAEREAKAEAARGVPDMPDEVSEILRETWEAVWRQCDEMGRAAREAHAAQIVKLQDERAEAEETVGIVEDERDAAIAGVEAAHQAVECLKTELDAARLRVATLEGRLEERAELLSSVKASRSQTSESAGHPETLDLPFEIVAKEDRQDATKAEALS